MKRIIVPYLIFSITAALAFMHPLSAFAADNPNDPKLQKKAGAAAATKGPALPARLQHKPPGLPCKLSEAQRKRPSLLPVFPPLLRVSPKSSNRRLKEM